MTVGSAGKVSAKKTEFSPSTHPTQPLQATVSHSHTRLLGCSVWDVDDDAAEIVSGLFSVCLYDERRGGISAGGHAGSHRGHGLAAGEDVPYAIAGENNAGFIGRGNMPNVYVCHRAHRAV